MAHPLRPTSALRPWWASVALAMLLGGCVPTAGTAQTPTQKAATASPTIGSPTPADATASTGGTVVPEIRF